MSDVERFAVRKDALIRESEEFPPAFPHGYLEFVVLYDAHVAAVAAARAEGRESVAQMWDQESLVMPLALIEAREQGQRDVFAFHPEWTVTGMCKPDCLPCQRLAELINERSEGYNEGRKDAARDLSVWIHENHPQIKGYADIPVEEALDIVEGKQ
jgi:hypothetical protein